MVKITVTEDGGKSNGNILDIGCTAIMHGSFQSE